MRQQIAHITHAHLTGRWSWCIAESVVSNSLLGELIDSTHIHEEMSCVWPRGCHRRQDNFSFPLRVMTAAIELWFPGPITESGAFWPPSYAHPVLAKKLNQFTQCTRVFMLLKPLIFCFCLILPAQAISYIELKSFHPVVLETYIWVCGNEKLFARPHACRKWTVCANYYQFWLWDNTKTISWDLFIHFRVDVRLNDMIMCKPSYEVSTHDYV